MHTILAQGVEKKRSKPAGESSRRAAPTGQGVPAGAQVGPAAETPESES
jgi:hypothetical protein